MRFVAILVSVGLSAGPVWATQPSPSESPAALSSGVSARASSDIATSNAPVDITAQESQVFQLQHLTIFKGAVEVLKDDARMRTPELRVYSKPKDGGAKPDKEATLSQQMGP